MANVIGEHTIKANVSTGSMPIQANVQIQGSPICAQMLSYGQATQTKAGIIRIATLQEATIGLDNTIAITPYTLREVATYGQGNGINITNKIISINTNVVATKDYVNDIKVELNNKINTLDETISTYGDIVTYSVSDFATAEQGILADSALQSNDNISELTNDVGYITSSALNGYATEEWVVEQGYITSASLPTVNNSTITIQKNGSTIESFTLNQSSNETINITVPTDTDDLTNGAGFITGINSTDVTTALGYTPTNPLDLATVATTGSYTDLTNKPTIPTVNNAKLTIQKNGTTVKTFTANASSNVTCNITVPTSINDLTTTAQQDAINSGATSTNIGQIATNASGISAINDLIPSQATSSNQLADKNFVNSSIATNTANFIGTFTSVADLEAYSGTLTNNDYAFVETTDTAGNTLYDRYKWNGTEWLFEYELNNSSFTSDQWGAINSGITANDVTLIGTALQPNDNITELTNNAGYITSSALSGYVQSTDLATVATTGAYSDLSGTPTIPTVNNATLTIQKNGTTVNTFTANASTDVTCNITVPTQASDISGCQTTTNLVTSVSSQSTDTQYPSAKCVYDLIGDIETALNTINSGS